MKTMDMQWINFNFFLNLQNREIWQWRMQSAEFFVSLPRTKHQNEKQKKTQVTAEWREEKYKK